MTCSLKTLYVHDVFWSCFQTHRLAQIALLHCVSLHQVQVPEFFSMIIVFFLFLISPFFLISDFTFFPYFLFHLLSKSKDFDSLPLLASSELQVSFFQWHIILFSRGLNGRISRDLHKLKKLYGFYEEKKILEKILIPNINIWL